MRRTLHAHVALLAALALLGGVAAGGAAGVDGETRRTLRGVDPAKSAAYLGDELRCDGGTTVIHKSKVNDEYCDCKDGADEPGASRVAARAPIANPPVPARRPTPRASTPRDLPFRSGDTVTPPERARAHQQSAPLRVFPPPARTVPLASPRLLTHLPRHPPPGSPQVPPRA